MYAIANKLGGWTIPACRKGALKYCAHCIAKFPETMVNIENWSGLPMFLFIERLSCTQSEHSWEHEIESLEELNEWEEKALLHKATAKFAAAKGIKVQDVTKADIEKTDLGLKGWAEIQLSVDVGQVCLFYGRSDFVWPLG